MAATQHIEADDEDFTSPELIQSYITKFQKAQASNSALVRYTKSSLDWFRMRVSKDTKYNRQRLIKNYGDYKRRTGKENKTLVGRLYYFEYKAEQAGDKVNNVYDQYPMIFIFNTSISEEGKKLIHGLNMHYLHPKERAIVYLKLLHVRNKKGWTNAMKLKISWQIIKTLVAHTLYEKAVHTYRVDRIQSKLIEIHPAHWEIAVFLRLETWVSVDVGAVDQKEIRKARRTG